MEHSRDDVVIQDSVIAIDRLKNRVDPVHGFTEDSRGKDAGNVQITSHFSCEGEFAELHVVLEVVDVLLLDRGIRGTGPEYSSSWSVYSCHTRLRVIVLGGGRTRTWYL